MRGLGMITGVSGAKLRLGVAALVGLSSACFLASLPASASTTFPGRNGQIAVAKHFKNLGVLGSKGGFRSLVNFGRDSVLLDPSYSPDAKRIVFSISSGEPDYFLGVLNVESGNYRIIKTGRLSAFSPSFLGSGKLIFAASTYPDNERPGTYMVNADGSNRHKLFDREEVAMSPGGRWFLAGDKRGASTKLLLLDSDGKVVRSLYSGNTDHPFGDPNFSPNGRWITFERTIGNRKQAHSHSDLFVIRRDGTHLRRLTFGGHAEDPVFSPNGRWIAFRRVKDQIGGNIVALSVKHPGKRRVLTHVRGAGFSDPTWAPRPGTSGH